MKLTEFIKSQFLKPDKEEYPNVYSLFTNASMYRYKDTTAKTELFEKAFMENKELAIKCLFFIRDKNGLGERQFFRTCLKYLGYWEPGIVAKILPYIPKYGRWDDIFSLLDTHVDKWVFKTIYDQLADDYCSMNPSLLAKWMPSENASSKATRELAKKIRLHLNMSPKQYRKILANLRSRLNIVESKMSKEAWKQIDYELLAKNALEKYRKAFLRHDEKRFKEFEQAKVIQTIMPIKKRPEEYAEKEMVQMLNRCYPII